MSAHCLTLFLASTSWLLLSGDVPRAREQPEKNTIAALAGDFYRGDGLGMNCSLTINPGGYFSFQWRGCLGVYGQNKGRAKVVAGHLVLKPEQPNNQDGFGGTPTDFIPVRWGDRLYLVPAQDKGKFCNEVNQGTEPREGAHGLFYLRRDDWKKKVTGWPVVPKEWVPLLLKKPLQGKIVEVLDGGRARVDLGVETGAWKDMELWVDTPEFGLVRVIEVEAKSCVVTASFPCLDKIAFKNGQGVRSRLKESD
jgi:hypothetical protein